MRFPRRSFASHTQTLWEIAKVQLLLVCTGNTCRSPLAEFIGRDIARARGLNIECVSAGTSAWDGATASDGALLVGLERGLDLAAHASRTLTAELIAQASLVLCMGAQHLDQVNALGGSGKSWVLSDFAHGTNARRGVSDPFGADLATYRATADELEQLMTKVLDRISAERHSASN